MTTTPKVPGNRVIEVVHYREQSISIDAVALRTVLDYIEREYGKSVHLTGITSFPDGSVRVSGTAYSAPGHYGAVQFSAFGTGAGEAGE